jgi:hypothetical protein
MENMFFTFRKKAIQSELIKMGMQVDNKNILTNIDKLC